LLIIFSVLLVLTMVLHPMGGSVEYLIHIRNVILVTHIIAIVSLPVGWVGFWGLTGAIGSDRVLSLMAFAMASIGVLAALIAAATNGLILPIYLDHFKDLSAAGIESIRPILRYGTAINQAFDYIYTFSFCGAIICWCTGALSTRSLPKWLAWMGIVLSGVIVFVFAFGVTQQDLSGLRWFITGIVIWTVLAGYVLSRAPGCRIKPGTAGSGSSIT